MFGLVQVDLKNPALNCRDYKLPPTFFLSLLSLNPSHHPRVRTTLGMRPFGVLPVFSLLLGACASSLDSRGSTLDRRDTNDVCANIGTDLVVSDEQGERTTVGMIGGSTFSQ